VYPSITVFAPWLLWAVISRPKHDTGLQGASFHCSRLLGSYSVSA
jgi:hypothetical protein